AQFIGLTELVHGQGNKLGDHKIGKTFTQVQPPKQGKMSLAVIFAKKYHEKIHHFRLHRCHDGFRL
ncbi:MAG: hypothetical protein K9J46_19345, partial [Saprospiraceae bacterium]|nr:hypothetical protein [Saprospiraceae bacterium]